MESGVAHVSINGAIRTPLYLSALSTSLGNRYWLCLRHEIISMEDGAHSKIVFCAGSSYLAHISDTTYEWLPPYGIKMLISQKGGDHNVRGNSPEILESRDNRVLVGDTDGIRYWYTGGELSCIINGPEILNIFGTNGRIQRIEESPSGKILLYNMYISNGDLSEIAVGGGKHFFVSQADGTIKTVRTEFEELMTFTFRNNLLSSWTIDGFTEQFIWRKSPFKSYGYTVFRGTVLLSQDTAVTYRYIYENGVAAVEAIDHGGHSLRFQYVAITGQGVYLKDIGK